MKHLKVKLRVSVPELNLPNKKKFEIPDDHDTEGIKKIFEFLDCKKKVQDPAIISPSANIKRLGTTAINPIPDSNKVRNKTWCHPNLPCSRRAALVKSKRETLPEPKQRSIRLSYQSYARYNKTLESKKILDIRDLRDYIYNKKAWDKLKLPSRIKMEIQEILAPRQSIEKLSIYEQNGKKIQELNEILLRISSKIELIYSNSMNQKKNVKKKKHP